MVSPKKLCNNGGDKSPSPEPFKEPEGLVTIELPNSRKNEGSKKIATQHDHKRKLILEIIVALFFINITVFGVLLYLSEETYIFKAKPLNTKNIEPVTNEKQYQHEVTIDDLIKKCVLTKSLKICCILFGETNVQFSNFCLDNNILPHPLDLDIRKRRDLTPKTLIKANSYETSHYKQHIVPEKDKYIYYDDIINHYPSDDVVYYDEQPYPYDYYPINNKEDHYHRYDKDTLDDSSHSSNNFHENQLPNQKIVEEEKGFEIPVIENRLSPVENVQTEENIHKQNQVDSHKEGSDFKQSFVENKPAPVENIHTDENINKQNHVDSHKGEDSEFKQTVVDNKPALVENKPALEENIHKEESINKQHEVHSHKGEESNFKQTVVDNKPALVENKPAVEENIHREESINKQHELHSHKGEESDFKQTVVDNKPALVENKPALEENIHREESINKQHEVHSHKGEDSNFKQTVVENKPALIENKPALVDNKPALVENIHTEENINKQQQVHSVNGEESDFKQTVVDNKPALVENKPAVEENIHREESINKQHELHSHKGEESDFKQTVVDNKPALVENKPAPVENIHMEENINKQDQVHSGKGEESDFKQPFVQNKPAPVENIRAEENIIEHHQVHGPIQPSNQQESSLPNKENDQKVNIQNTDHKTVLSPIINQNIETSPDSDTLSKDATLQISNPIVESQNSEIQQQIQNEDDILSINIPLNNEEYNSEDESSNKLSEIESTKQTNDKMSIDNVKDRTNVNEDQRTRQKSDMASASIDFQSSQQTMLNPCFSPNQFGAVGSAMDGSQMLKIVPSSSHRVSQFFVNPPVYPFIQNPYMIPQQFINQQIQSSPVQVSGPGGQFYICNPIAAPNNGIMSNNIAGMPGVEVRRDAANLQDLVGSLKHEEKPSSKSRAANIICPIGHEACSDGSKCIPKFHMCDSDVQCSDGSDEEFCTCRERVGKLRTCDGYFDCPQGDDELGCFGCESNEFSCDDWSKSRKSTCIPIEQRCDNIIQCEITGKDEEDCSVLADNVGSQPFNKVSNSVGFLHRNYKGNWYPTCYGSNEWSIDACKVESGPTTMNPKTHMMPTSTKYDGYFINVLPDDQVSLVKTCIQDMATFVECPPLYCGMRISVKNPYRKHEVDISAEKIMEDLERASGTQNKDFNIVGSIEGDNILGNSRIVGGKPSQPAAWPWLVTIYKNGAFHCGGALVSELWIVTASHCVDRYWQFYYEVQAGVLRRFSYSPMEQNRWVTVVVANDNYDRMTLKNDIALMKLSSPVRFNRYVRPICLPTEFTAGRDFAPGPSDGTICTTVGWGATMEHGADPDHMREVEVPIKRCKHGDDIDDGEICAGLSEGGKDACQGDSGGPLMCRNPNNPSQWYLAGIVSHGEGCARADEPGVYAKVSKYMGWIVENMAEGKFIPRFPLQKCPGYTCKRTNRCIPKKNQCDTIVDCLLADDEVNCKPSLPNLFSRMAEIKTDYDESILEATIDNFNNTQHKGPEIIAINNSTNGKINQSQLSDNYFMCKSLLQLIPSTKKCNKIVDCEDGSDEVGCKCADYVKNRNPTAICDGITDCYDLSDENCVKCPIDTYHCRQSKKCIGLSKRCDGVFDCDKNEDEWDCVALTNGKTLTFDSDLRPKLAMAGIITINKNGIWTPLCQNENEKTASLVSNVCYLLGFEEYMGYHEYQVADKPLNANEEKEENNANKTCSGLYVKCSNVSLDISIHNVHLDNVTDEVELYTSPWNAVIYSDGIYRCMGAILNSRWIVTSVNCFEGINMLNENYVTVLLGKGKATLQVKGPHEQIQKIVESVRISETDIILLRTESNIVFNRYIKDVRLSLRRDSRRKEKCVAIGLYSNKAKYEFLTPIENCVPGFRCFETKIKTNCSDTLPWSGIIFCDPGNGWYSAAVFSEKTGLCGLSSVVQYTSLPFNKNKIIKAMEKTSLNIDGPDCNGFRCTLGECISKNKTCNGIEDCTGGEDEEPSLCYENERLCHLTGECACPRTELKCKNKKCIPKSEFCDRNDDCGDFSDEPDVCNCRAYLELSSPEKICDGIVHCMDRSDEDPQICPCPSDGFKCLSTGHCVANDMVCDGYEDCPNAEDEKVCFDIVDEKNTSSNAGELKSRTGGVWHSGCFNKTYTPEELNKICFDIGFDGDASNFLPPPKNQRTVAMRPVIDKFDFILLRRKANRFKILLRSGNEPFVQFVPDENCYKLFLACL